MRTLLSLIKETAEIEEGIQPTSQKSTPSIFSKQFDKNEQDPQDEQSESDDPDAQSVQKHDDEKPTDSDYEEDDEDETWVSFYQKRKHAHDDLNQFLLMFWQHLKSISGGHFKMRYAMHNTQNVCKIVEHLDPGSKRIDCLFIKGGISVCKNWAQPMLDSKKMRPGTVKSYLCSLAKFFDFLVDAFDTGVTGIPKIGKELKDKSQHMMRRVKAWGSSISRLHETERWEKINEDSRNTILLEEVIPSMEIKGGGGDQKTTASTAKERRNFLWECFKSDWEPTTVKISTRCHNINQKCHINQVVGISTMVSQYQPKCRDIN